MSQETKALISENNKWFFFTMVYLLIDYGRPQDLLPIAVIRPGMIATVVLIFFVIKRPNLQKYASKQTWLILLFVTLLGLHVPIAANNHFAWITFKDMALCLPYILSVIACVTTIQRLKRMIFVLLLLMAYISLYSLLHKGVGPGSYFMDENDLALYINMYLPFCFFLMLYEKRVKMKLFYSTLFVIGLAAIVVSRSRGGFIGLLAVTMVIWTISTKKVLSLLLIVLVCLLLYMTVSTSYFQEMETATHTNSGTARDRIESWKSGWKMFLDNPLGVGGNNFLVRFPEYQTDYFQRGMWGRAAHSLWFTLIPELGIPGVVIYFLLLFYNVRDIFRLKYVNFEHKEDTEYFRALSRSLLASLAGFFAAGTFLSVLYYAHYWYVTAMVVAMTNISRSLRPHEV